MRPKSENEHKLGCDVFRRYKMLLPANKHWIEYLSPCHHLVNSGIRHTRYQNASQSRPAHISLQAAINLGIDI
jgi:hypothetical protein